MILSMNFQIQLACVGFFLGTVGAFVYDIMRIIRLYISHSKFIEYLEDYLFWVVYGLVVFLCCLKVNYGEIRPFFLVSLFLAMIIYYFFVASIIHSFMIPLIDLILKIIKTVLNFLALPIIFLAKVLKRMLKFVYIFCENNLKISKKYEKIKRKLISPYFRSVLNEKKKNGKGEENFSKEKNFRKKTNNKKSKYKKSGKKENKN